MDLLALPDMQTIDVRENSNTGIVKPVLFLAGLHRPLGSQLNLLPD
jgi:hypothetical protein